MQIVARRVCRLLAPGARSFSEYFSNIDKEAAHKYDDKFYAPRVYTKMQRKWQEPLERKRRKRERKMERLAQIVRPRIPLWSRLRGRQKQRSWWCTARRRA